MKIYALHNSPTDARTAHLGTKADSFLSKEEKSRNESFFAVLAEVLRKEEKTWKKE